MLALPPQPPRRTDRPVLVAHAPRRRHVLWLRSLPAGDLDRHRLRGRRALSGREIEVLTLAAQGLTGAQIADQLGLSESTIETHVRRAVDALGAHNRVHAVALAIGRGLIEAPRS